MLKKFLLFCLLAALVLAASRFSFALEDCAGKEGSEAAECWSRRAGELQQLITQSQGQQKTLSSTISYLNNKISLTQAQIHQTEEELKSLEEQIATLAVKIERLDINLTDISELLVSRVGEAYKRSLFNPGWQLLSTGGLTDFLEQKTYLASAQQNDRKLLLELQNARDINQQQKEDKEVKQTQAEALRQSLASQNSALNSQIQEKQRLLTVTRNDEQRYQSLLAEAQAQRAAFSRFVSRFGGASILSNQTKCNDWGCYYNQRDSQWGTQLIGLSSENVANVGCLITSMAMVASFYDKNITPGQIAASSSPFFGSTAYMLQGSWTANGVTMSRVRVGSSTSAIDSELAAGRPVIVGIYGGPDHFLVIKGKENGEYIMHDPFPAGAADAKFTDHYPLSAISSVDRVTVQ